MPTDKNYILIRNKKTGAVYYVTKQSADENPDIYEPLSKEEAAKLGMDQSTDKPDAKDMEDAQQQQAAQQEKQPAESEEEPQIEEPAWAKAVKRVDKELEELNKQLDDMVKNAPGAKRIKISSHFRKAAVNYAKETGDTTYIKGVTKAVTAIQQLVVNPNADLDDETIDILKRHAYIRIKDGSIYIPMPNYLDNNAPGTAGRIKLKASRALANKLMSKNAYAAQIGRSVESSVQASMSAAMDRTFSTKKLGEVIDMSDINPSLRRFAQDADVFILTDDDGNISTDPADYFEAYKESLNILMDVVEEYGLDEYAGPTEKFLKSVKFDGDIARAYTKYVHELIAIEAKGPRRSIRNKLSAIVVKKVSEYILAMMQLQENKLALMPRSQTFGAADYITIPREGEELVTRRMASISVKSAAGRTKKIGAASGATSHADAIVFSENGAIDNAIRSTFKQALNVFSRALVRRKDWDPEQLRIDLLDRIDQLLNMQLSDNQLSQLQQLREFVDAADIASIKDSPVTHVQNLNQKIAEFMLSCGISYAVEYEAIKVTKGGIKISRSQPTADGNSGLLNKFKPMNKQKEATIVWYYDVGQDVKEEEEITYIDDDSESVISDFNVSPDISNWSKQPR